MHFEASNSTEPTMNEVKTSAVNPRIREHIVKSILGIGHRRFDTLVSACGADTGIPIVDNNAFTNFVRPLFSEQGGETAIVYAIGNKDHNGQLTSAIKALRKATVLFPEVIETLDDLFSLIEIEDLYAAGGVTALKESNRSMNIEP